MKRSIFLATLILVFGIAVGCSEKKNGAAPPSPAPAPPPACQGEDCHNCASDEVWDPYDQICKLSSVANFQLYDDSLSITSGKVWEEFLEAYTASVSAGFWCRDNRDDGLQFWVGANDCGTYDYNRTLTLNISSLVISAEGTTKANLILTARSGSWSVIQGIYIPITGLSMTASRYGETQGDENVADVGFQMSTTLNGPNGPKVLFIRGDRIDFTDNKGLKLSLYYGDPGNVFSKKFAEATVYVY